MTPMDATLHIHLHVIVCVLFALLTAGSNACAAVLQRTAAAQVPPARSMHVSLLADLVRRRVWLAGIGMVAVAAVAQAAALATGPIALVQPVFIVELPVTLVLAALASHDRSALRQLTGIPQGRLVASSCCRGPGSLAAGHRAGFPGRLDQPQGGQGGEENEPRGPVPADLEVV